MGYGLGLPRNAQGIGVTPEDHQRVLWGLYRSHVPLIVKGLEVTGTASMAYKVAAGVVYIPMGEARAILVPIDGVTVQTTAAPSAGSRVDVLYVGQDGAVKVGTYLPAGSAEIDRRTVQAGTTATTATTGLRDRKFQMLFGATMGRLAKWVDNTAYGAAWDTASKVRFSAWLPTLPSDRLLDFRFSQTLATNATGPQSIIWELWMDGNHLETREMAVGPIAETKTTVFSREVLAGDHRIELRARRGQGNGTITYFGGGSLAFPGNVLEVMDVGMIW